MAVMVSSCSAKGPESTTLRPSSWSPLSIASIVAWAHSSAATAWLQTLFRR